ncbi:MAG: hypothetical protein CME06_00635 [Gemmatimonadetes bacterium]|nr:hypothetical protein [Gemmatimonadota bacterium]
MMRGSILIVDDDEGVRDVLEQLLEILGHEPRLCGDKESALEALEERGWDAAFFDILLGDGNGLELLEHALSVQPDLPVIIISGVATSERVDQAKELGASGFLLKPFRADEVTQELNRALVRGTLSKQRRRLSDALERAESQE